MPGSGPPDERLGVRATVTLAAPITADATTIPIIEPPTYLVGKAGAFFRGGMDIRVDDEILTYGGVTAQPPYALTGCQRGRYGTRAAAHDTGAKLDNLQEVFGLYVPDGDSTLLDELAQRIADVVNACHIDMIYFDGLDGADTLAGNEWDWHYGPKFALSVMRRIHHPVRTEASAWWHPTWHIMSQFAAWDYARRDPKRLLDLHVGLNNWGARNLLPGDFGWQGLQSYDGPYTQATTPGFIEYLGAKCIGYDTALSLENASPEAVRQIPSWGNLLTLLGRYESLRLSQYFPESIKAQLREAGAEFTLRQDAQGQWQLQRVEYLDHRVTALDNVANVWPLKSERGFAAQTPGWRIQALMAAGAYDAPDNNVLTDFTNAGEFTAHADAAGMSHLLATSTAQVKAGTASGLLTATSTLSGRAGTWVKAGKGFGAAGLDMRAHPALGVWVYGDGKGAVLNLQLTDNRGEALAPGEHYIIVDFTGWRYFELIEPEAKRATDYQWPYGSYPPTFHREDVDLGRVEALNLYINNVPAGDHVALYLSPIRALTIQVAQLQNPRLTLGGKTLTFPVTLKSGQYLEFRSMTDCKLYDPNGNPLQDIQPQGEAPALPAEGGEVVFACDGPAGLNPRAIVTAILNGPTLSA